MERQSGRAVQRAAWRPNSLLGAAAGCVTGLHEAKKHAREQAARAHQGDSR
jgi:hypothetical protein